MDNYYLLYVLHSLEKEIRSLEKERLNNDITNTDRLQPLYDLYRKNKEELKELI